MDFVKSSGATSQLGAPVVPSSEVPEGFVWPPVEGRAVLRELDDFAVEPVRTSMGMWSAIVPARWRLFSTEVYPNLELARHELFEWARRHGGVAAQAVLSPGRCLVLVPEGEGGRLWQIVPIQPSLRSKLDELSRSEQVKKWTRTLANVARSFFEVPAKLAQASLPLEGNLDRFGWDKEAGRPVYIGFVPPPSRLPSIDTPPSPASLTESLAKNLDSTLFELALTRRTVLLGIAATLDDMALDAPLSALREQIQEALGRSVAKRGETRAPVLFL